MDGNKIYAGDRVGIYIVLRERDNRSKDGHRLYDAKCVSCGKEFVFTAHDIKRAKTCKHVHRSYIDDSGRSANSKIKSVYHGMIDRCENPNNRTFRYYGGKGVSICQMWQNYFEFERWAINNGYSDGLTIDRIDPSGDYEPSNCRWIPLTDNARYKSTTNYISVNGITMSGREWSDALGVGTNTINTYVRQYGMEKTLAFIEARMHDGTVKRKSKQTWMNAYGLE